jgi:tRNA-2-methylthio-N6-dimethylallyladenosine synthase
VKFLVRTYGCQMNERDSESVAALLAAHGHEAVSYESAAEVVVVNTCSVRAKAEAKALGKLGLLVAASRSSGRRVGAIGCMVQRLQARLFEKVPGLDFAVGPHSLARLPEILDLLAQGRRGILDAAEPDPTTGDRSLAGHLPGGPTAFVNILLGCSRQCAYCIVPAVRGPEWSRPAEAVVREVSGLVERGVREVTLLGQSVMSYGARNAVWPDGYRSERGYVEPFPRLLEALAELPGLARLRFTSGHPSGCTAELARAIAELPPVCEHIHLPVQSGSDRILKKMRRGYTAAGYRRAVARLRAAKPALAVTTDIIVGFPTETEEDFQATRDLCGEIGFDNAFVFKYSARSGTPAAAWDDDVPADEKLRRNKALLADQGRRSRACNEALIGQTVEGLAEGLSPRNPTRWTGRTRTNKVLIFEATGATRAGDLVAVTVERATPQALYGRVVTGGSSAVGSGAQR